MKQMNLTLTPENWGEAALKDITQVLNSVHQVFLPCFGSTMNQRMPTVSHSDDCPRCARQRSVIYLTAKNRFWCQYAYQFAHEYCHYQITGTVPQQLRWFEESLCELASYYFLLCISDLWKTAPPYPNWFSYADEFRKYVENDAKKATAFHLDLSSNLETLRYLEAHEYDREKNAYVALVLLPIFTITPSLWSAVPLLGQIPANLTFKESLQCWQRLAPAEFRDKIKQIAHVFHLEI